MKMKRVLALILAGIMLLGAAGVAALAADSDAQGITVLQSDTNTLTVDADTLLDLNGYDINELTVNGDGACYVFDSATKEFEDDYGVIKSYTGDVQPFCTPEEDGTGWLMFDNNGADASFHYVVLQVTDMVLQPKADGAETYDPNLYYKCNFKGDEVVAQNVKTFGVALSVVGEPTEENLHTKCGYSVFEVFHPGENGNQNNGTLLTGVMKETNANLINKRNANLEIYGRAYIELKNGDYVFGEARNRTLKEQTEEANKLWTIFDDARKEDIRQMHRRYRNVMQTWNLTGVTANFSDVVEDAVTWYKEFENLPTVYECVNEQGEYDVEKMRQLIVDFFRIQLSFKWTPNDTFMYQDKYETDKKRHKHIVNITPETVYEGLPYAVTEAYYDADQNGSIDLNDPVEGEARRMGTGNIYKVLNYYDPATGIVDITKMNSDPQIVIDMMTSNCSGGLFWGWGRVTNGLRLHDSSCLTPANGCLPVCDPVTGLPTYEFNEYLYTAVSSNGEIRVSDVQGIIDDNEAQDMYRAYAAMQPGDGLLVEGHVRMCSAVSEVKYKSNGEIDPVNSYAWYIDQNSYGSNDRNYSDQTHVENYSYTQDNGYTVRKLGGLVDDPIKGNKISFSNLWGDFDTGFEFGDRYITTRENTPDGKRETKGYIPVTLAEFCTEEQIANYKKIAQAQFAGTERVSDWDIYYNDAYEDVTTYCGIERSEVISSTSNIHLKDEITVDYIVNELGGKRFQTNYTMSDFRITVEDAEGNVLLEEKPPVYTGDRSQEIKMTSVLSRSKILNEEILSLYAGKGYQFKIAAHHSTGEWFYLMDAELVS